MIARSFGGDAEKTADYLQWPLDQIQAALQYARDFPEEIEAAIADNDSYDSAKLRGMLPNLMVFTVPPDGDEVSSGGKSGVQEKT